MDSSFPSQILPKQSVNLKKTISNASNTNQIDPAQQITDTFTKIHDTIDNLDSKVQALMDKHEIEFLFAWQNHIKKIKNELKEIKDRSEEKEKLMNSNERMVAMEKQMALFRDESLKLYDEVEEKKNEIQVLRRRLKEQDLELQILRQENKQLIKNSKMAEAKFVIEHQKLMQLQKELQKYKHSMEGSQRATLEMVTVDPKNLTSKNLSIVNTKTLGFENFNLNAIRSTEHTGMNFEKKGILTVKETSGQEGHSLSKLKQQKLNRLSVTNKWQTNGFEQSRGQQIMEESNGDLRKKISLPMSNKSITKTHNFMMIEPSIYDNELKSWFLECVKSIKKEISSRKSGFTSPAVDVMKVTSLEEFKTIDRLRLLEMFLQNQKLLVYMYQKVFPDRLKEIETFLNQKDMRQDKNRQQQQNRANRTISHRQGGYEGINENKQMSIDMELLQERLERRPKNDSGIRVKSVSKASKSQPIRNRIIMRDGKLNLIF